MGENMRIRKKENEDVDDTDELLAQAITEDIAKWLQDFLGNPVDSPINLGTKGDIYYVVLERFRQGVEI